MDHRQEARDLTSRRARLTPKHAGLPSSRANRRVLGLRRGEVAHLAGSVSSTTSGWNGGLSGVSDAVLNAIAGAPQLDESERAHLIDLAHAAGTRQSGPTGLGQRPSLAPVITAAVAKHIGSLLAKLDLPPDGQGHRRVLAVLAYLRSWSPPVDATMDTSSTSPLRFTLTTAA